MRRAAGAPDPDTAEADVIAGLCFQAAMGEGVPQVMRAVSAGTRPRTAPSRTSPTIMRQITAIHTGHSDSQREPWPL